MSDPQRLLLNENGWSPKYNGFERHQMTQMYNAITELKLWNWLSTYNPEEKKGFLWSSHPNIEQITSHRFVVDDGHSGASMAVMLRHMEGISKNTLPSPTRNFLF